MKEEKTEVKSLTIHGRMAKIKRELGEIKIPKSGHNKFAGFKYHELTDFIKVINALNLEHGVNDFVEIDENGNECRITLTNVDNTEDKIVIRTPFREAEMLAKGGAPSNVDAVQRMGSTITYNRRYLYMTAYNIQENDGVDILEQPEKTPENQKKQEPPKKALKKITNENLSKGIDQVNKGEIFVFDLEEKLKDYDLTKEQQVMIDQLKKNEQNKKQ